jgi:glyoxylase-like metal-dependent hydrolase (beta-lactamase superfamily II)
VTDNADNQVYFKQLLSGRDFAVGDSLAQQMVNFVYLIGDRSTGECMVIDPAYAVDDLVNFANNDGMKITGALATHYHPDHIGGSMMNYRIEGITRLLEHGSIGIHVNKEEAPWVLRTTGVSETDLVAHDAGDIVKVGNIDITLVHTPGHTPGSQCFLVNGCLISGDTLFLDGCGRTDLPGSDPEMMYESLQTLNSLPSTTIIYPGHQYSQPAHEPLAQVQQHNFVLKPMSKDQWTTIFAG